MTTRARTVYRSRYSRLLVHDGIGTTVSSRVDLGSGPKNDDKSLDCRCLDRVAAFASTLNAAQLLPLSYCDMRPNCFLFGVLFGECLNTIFCPLSFSNFLSAQFQPLQSRWLRPVILGRLRAR